LFVPEGRRPYPTRVLPERAPAHPGPSRVHAVDARVVVSAAGRGDARGLTAGTRGPVNA
jgi:hypothetical protein